MDRQSLVRVVAFQFLIQRVDQGEFLPLAPPTP